MRRTKGQMTDDTKKILSELKQRIKNGEDAFTVYKSIDRNDFENDGQYDKVLCKMRDYV